MNFKSLPQLLDFFKDESTCIEYYERIRWNGNPVCPHCGAPEPYKTNIGYRCSKKGCLKKFTVRVGTIFHSSKLPLRTWFAAMWLATSHKKGISSIQLGKDLGITQKSAWHVLHRIREMLKDKAPRMVGETNPVETDEAYVGGAEPNKHYSARRSDKYPHLRNDGKPYRDKKIVLGIIERDGKIVLKHIPFASVDHMVPAIKKHVPEGSQVYTDESSIYRRLKKNYKHGTVNHKLKIYVVGDAYTNTIEGFWSLLKRGIHGIYHQVSEKHFERYLDEFAARYNTRQHSEFGRLQSFLKQSEIVLSYKRLIADNNK